MKFKGRCLLSMIYESKRFSLFRKYRSRVISVGNDKKFTDIHQGFGHDPARLMVTRTNHLFSVAFQFWKNTGKY